MLRLHAGFCQQHQLLGLEKLGSVCVRYRNSGKTSSSRALPTGDVRVLLINHPGAQLTQRGLEGLLASLMRALGLFRVGLRGGGSVLLWTLPAIAFGPEDETSELQDVHSWWCSVIGRVVEGEGTELDSL